MEKKKEILPINYPSFTCWTWHANLFAVIEKRKPAADWIFSNYIQIHCYPELMNKRKLHLDFFPFYKSFFECPLMHTQYIDREFVSEGWTNIKEFLIFCIRHKNYVYGVCNEKWILRSEEDYYHELFIYGYDLDNELCYVADFTLENSGRYSFAKVPMEAVCKGFESVPPNKDYFLRYEGGFVLTKYAPQIENQYKLDSDLIKTNLYEYLEGINSHVHFRELYNMNSMETSWDGNNVDEYVFGMKVYDYLRDYLLASEDVFDIDIRPFHNLYHHKKLMLERIKYLAQHNYVEVVNKEVENYKQLVDESKIIVGLLLKDVAIGENKNLERIIEILRKIKNEERRLLTQIYNRL